MPEGRPAFVHDLRLALWIEILCDLAHDPHHFALPGFQQRRMLFDEVEDVLLWFSGEALVSLTLVFLFAKFGNGPPEIVDLLLQMLFTVFLPPPFFLG